MDSSRRASRCQAEPVNKVGGQVSRSFIIFARLPAFEIAAQYEKFSPDLNDADVLFLNDSTEVPHGKPSQFGGVGNVQKHPFRCDSFGRPHCVPSLCAGEGANKVPFRYRPCRVLYVAKESLFRKVPKFFYSPLIKGYR